jgi:hypothetical protein
MVSEKVSEKVAAPGRVKWPGAAERETLLPCRRVAHGHVKWPGAAERDGDTYGDTRPVGGHPMATREMAGRPGGRREKPHRPRRRSANGYVKGWDTKAPY